jgi:hypothetical protein
MNPTDTTPSRETNSPLDAPAPRQGWEEQYQRMVESSDDALLDGDIPTLTKWDETEWEW